MATQAQITAVQQLYVSYLGRAADKAGLDFWSNAIATGTATIASVATGLTLATEYTSKYAGLTTDALVDAVYTNVLGRTADAAGKAFWVASFANGSVKADTFVSSLIQSLGTQDQATINNKTFVAQTYTDTAGTDYTPAGGAAVIVGVTSDPATVTAAIGSISNGTLPGQVPGLALINASVAAAASVVDLQKATATANPTFDTVKDGAVTHAELTTAINTLTAARDLASKGGVAANPTQTTDQLIGTKAGADAALTTATTAVQATAAGKTAAANYDAALAAKVSAADVTANTAAIASAESGLNASFGAGNALWTGLDAKITTDGAITDAASLFTALTNPIVTSADRALLVAEVNAKAGAYGTALVAAADKSLAITAANDKVDSAKTALISATDSTKANAYTSAVDADKTATDNLTKTQAADAAVTAAKAIDVKYTAAEKLASDAALAVTNFDPAKATLTNVSTAATGDTVDGTANKADVFYFASKVATADFTIGGASNFGAGDAIVLGSAYTFNSGAVSTGNNSTLEFFFVKTATGTNVVIENTAFANATTTVDATTGNVTASPDATVISLTGVTTDHLAVHNGVVSYV